MVAMAAMIAARPNVTIVGWSAARTTLRGAVGAALAGDREIRRRRQLVRLW
jgi:hypothetical protein